MSSKKFFLGTPPFRYLVNHLVTQDDDFKNDARFILQINDVAFAHAAACLEEFDGFLDHGRIKEIVGPVLGDDSDRVTDFLIRVSNIVHGAETEPAEAMAVFADAIRDKLDAFSPIEREALAERIRLLTVHPEGVGKQFKARQLAEATGCELDAFRIVCDMRPIFDRDRIRVEGAIPITVMRLEFTTPDGDDAVTEVRITEKQLADLLGKISDAQNKLNLIRSFMSGHSVTIPKTKATVSGD